MPYIIAFLVSRAYLPERMAISDHNPFSFSWGVDQDGYEIRREPAGLLDQERAEFVVGRGGQERRYQPLDDPALWLRFGETCRDRDGVLAFTSEFGLTHKPNQWTYGALGLRSLGPGDRLDDVLGFASHVRAIAELLNRNRNKAMNLFNTDRPNMVECILQDKPHRFDYRWVPLSLRDALLHQIGDAITGNRQFRRCDNVTCSKWFRLGPHQAQEGGRRQTTTVRRRFCSDYCRVASARRQKREAATNA